MQFATRLVAMVSGVGVMIPCMGGGWDPVCCAQPLWANVDLTLVTSWVVSQRRAPSPPPILIILSIALCAVAQRSMGWPVCRFGMSGLGEDLCLLSFSCCGAPVGSQDMVLNSDDCWWWRLAALESRTAILMLTQWYRTLAGLVAVIYHGSWARECTLSVVLRLHALQRFCA